MAEARSGALFFNLGVTLARVAIAFILAMTVGTAIGYLMGRVRLANRLGDPWLILLPTCRRSSSSCWPISGPD
jgi:NitT/TauT family transport system permease protein